MTAQVGEFKLVAEHHHMVVDEDRLRETAEDGKDRIVSGRCYLCDETVYPNWVMNRWQTEFRIFEDDW